MDLAKLKAELAKPEYAGLDDVAAADLMATRDKTVDRETLTAGDVVGSLVWAEYDALTDIQKRHIDLIVAAQSLTITPTLRAELRDLFPQGSGTRKNLRDLLQRPGSRAEEAGLGRNPTTSQIADARRL